MISGIERWAEPSRRQTSGLWARLGRMVVGAPYSMHFGPDGGGMVTFLVYPPDDLVLVVKIQWLGG